MLRTYGVLAEPVQPINLLVAARRRAYPPEVSPHSCDTLFLGAEPAERVHAEPCGKMDPTCVTLYVGRVGDSFALPGDSDSDVYLCSTSGETRHL